MAPFLAVPWFWLFAGMLAGCWIGATVGSAGVLLLAERRMKRLETINELLRMKLRASRPRTLAQFELTPVLRPFRVMREPARIPIDRIASGN